MIYSLTLELMQIFFVAVLPLLGAIVIASLVSGVFQGVLRIQEPAIGYIFRFLACAICLYIILPSLSNAFISVLHQSLAGK